MIININGQFYSPENAKISIFDRGFLFGDSIYEVTRTYHQIPFLLEEHLDRLEKSAAILGMTLTISKQLLAKQIRNSLDKFFATNNSQAFIRLIVTRGEDIISLAPSENLQNNYIIIIKPQPDNPNWWYQAGVKFIIADNQKTPKQTIDPNCKSGNHLPHVMAIKQAQAQKAFDAIMLNQHGQVTEGTSNNIWIVKDGVVKTPPLQSGILEGLTRKTVLELMRRHDIPHQQLSFFPDELKSAQECFFTSSTKEIVPIIQVDQTIIGTGKPGPITKHLHMLYNRYIEQYCTTKKLV